MNIYITGASGFIGSSLLNFFRQKSKYNVIGISHSAVNRKEKSMIYSDYSDIDWLVNQLDINKHIILVHCAVYIPNNRDNYLDISTFNINKKINDFIYSVFSQVKIKKAIYFSSVAVYGYGYKDLLDINEQSQISINDFYAESKIYGEKVVLDFFEKKGYILRLSSPYGLGKIRKNILEKMFDNVCNNEDLIVYGKGRRLQDYIYIADICHVINNLIEYNIDAGVYNLASGYSYKMVDLARILIKITNSRSRIKSVDYSESYSVKINNNKLQKAIGIRFLDIYEGINNMKNTNGTGG